MSSENRFASSSIGMRPNVFKMHTCRASDKDLAYCDKDMVSNLGRRLTFIIFVAIS